MGFSKDFVRRTIASTLSRALVQELFNVIDLPLPQLMEIGAFGEEPSDQPVDLFHTAFLPTVVRRTEEWLGAQSHIEFFMTGVFTAIRLCSI